MTWLWKHSKLFGLRSECHAGPLRVAQPPNARPTGVARAAGRGASRPASTITPVASALNNVHSLSALSSRNAAIRQCVKRPIFQLASLAAAIHRVHIARITRSRRKAAQMWSTAVTRWTRATATTIALVPDLLPSVRDDRRVSRTLGSFARPCSSRVSDRPYVATQAISLHSLPMRGRRDVPSFSTANWMLKRSRRVGELADFRNSGEVSETRATLAIVAGRSSAPA